MEDGREREGYRVNWGDLSQIEGRMPFPCRIFMADNGLTGKAQPVWVKRVEHLQQKYKVSYKHDLA